jgi:NADPH-ferrihemoprotein reductase
MARRTIEKNGAEGLNDWGKIYLYFGCRNSKKDFLYKEPRSRYLTDVWS